MNGTSYTCLEDRGLLKISGDDARSFLQGLLTNDIHKVTATEAIYSCLLSPQGKYLYDFFVIEWQGSLWIDCASERCAELARKLTMYKLRSKVTIENVSADYQVASIPAALETSFSDCVIFTDPRHSALGMRLISKKSELAAAGLSHDPHAYEHLRLSLAIPEGEKDLVQDKAFPLEYGFDKLSAIDYKKGCYVGQEVTARTTYRGVVRKQIYQLSGPAPLAAHGTDIMAGASKIGSMRSSYGNTGIALIRIEDYERAMETGDQITLDGVPITLTLPEWASASA